MILGWTALGIVALLLGIELSWALVTMPHVDWETYVDALGRLINGQGLYSPAQLSGSYVTMATEWVGFVYPPLAAVLLAPLAIPVVGPAVWYGTSIGIFLTGLAALVRREAGHLLPWPLAVAFLPLLIIAPFWDGVITGNVNLLIVGLLAWSWAAPGRWIGPLAGVLAVVRIFPGSLAVQRVRATGWRGALVPVGVAIGLVIVTLPIVGLNSWTDYATALTNAVPQCTKQVNSLVCALTPAMGAAVAEGTAMLLTAILLVGSLLVRNSLASFTMITLVWVLPMPDLSPNYLLAVILPAYVVGARGYRKLITHVPWQAAASSRREAPPRA
ncbi:MAG: glycosyltransferase family 87 protein [Candidatus Limnocylindrales bacterium]